MLCRGCLQQLQKTQTRTAFNIFQKWGKKAEPTTPSNFSIVQAGKVSPMRTVPEGIEMPDYAHAGKPVIAPQRKVFILDHESIQCMREAGKLGRKLLDLTASYIQVGVTTDRLDEVLHQACIDNNAYPSTLNYNCFPKSLCTSVNNVMVHGIPDDRPLEDGDIITADITVFLNGFHADLSETFLVGNVDDAGKRLVEYAKKCRDEAIKVCGPDVPISAIGNTISAIAAEGNYYVSPSFIGHGINTYFHCKPDIWHYANFYPESMMAGLTFTIEPVILESVDRMVTGDDDWTVYAQNHTRSAQFEHTILITKSGFEVLTAGEDEDFTVKPIETTSEVDDQAKALHKEDWTFDQKT
ncbi:methionine aminopeptidase 1D, mitochondrial-like [Strongylocentrotus purpuratus]|uniref:Methionine aminopeptidase n=1 Tax=Strongylocentrotus purpuratus TaxID=7668 RepID=A0A7M7NMK0_STRPU|nr:methionine aminopeptidase 1D, mitochondrial-like [Strongylocentrotus purpuratus]